MTNVREQAASAAPSVAAPSVAAPLIPIMKPYLGEEEIEAVARALRSGWIAQGPLVAAFERALAERLGVPHVVATTSCTSALHLALLCAGVGPGDEVIVPSFSFIASANAIVYTGARPVFVEIDAETYNLDPARIEAAITPRTKLILAVDQIGLAAEMDAIAALARKHGLLVMEDAAPALGATLRGRPVGALSQTTCFSFHPRKSITTGEGGALATFDTGVAERARMLRGHGMSVSDLARHQANSVIIEEYAELGYNYRMTDIQAAIGIEQLKKLDAILARRRALAERYTRLLAGVEGVAPPYAPVHAPHTYQSYCVRLDPAGAAPREAVMARMLARGVATRRGVMAIHQEPWYVARFGRVSLPITEAAARETLLLPLFYTMTEAEQDRVVATLREAIQPC